METMNHRGHCLFGKPMRDFVEFRAEVGIKTFDALFFQYEGPEETLRRPCTLFKIPFTNITDSAALEWA